MAEKDECDWIAKMKEAVGRVFVRALELSIYRV